MEEKQRDTSGQCYIHKTGHETCRELCCLKQMNTSAFLKNVWKLHVRSGWDFVACGYFRLLWSCSRIEVLLQLFCLLLFTEFVTFVFCLDLSEVKAKAGENATLECLSAEDATITLLRWSRLDLLQEGYVFFYRDEQLYKNYQHPSFVDRVELRGTERSRDEGWRLFCESEERKYQRHWKIFFISVSITRHRKGDKSSISKTIELLAEDPGEGVESKPRWVCSSAASWLMLWDETITDQMFVFYKDVVDESW